MNEEFTGWKFALLVTVALLATIIFIGESTGLTDAFINSFAN